MTFHEERVLNIRGNSPYWCSYTWDHGTKLWRFHSSNEGFFNKYNLPSAFSEQERLLLEIKLS